MTFSKKKIFFIIPAMTGGGAERVITHLLRFIDREKFEISLVLIKKVGPFLKDLPDDIKIFDLKCKRTLYAPPKIISLIYKNKPQIVFSTLGHLNLAIASIIWLMPKQIKFIARESNTISYHNKNERYPRLFDLLFKTVYKNFHTIVCQSEFMKSDLTSNYNMPENKMTVIRNPVDYEKINALSSNGKILFNPNEINFLAVGRLSRQKGYERLLKTVALLKQSNVHLTILGEGEDRQKLENIVSQLSINHKVSFLGFKNNPYKYMKQADCLIITSYYEGLPNVALEANACGTPVLAFNTPGLSEIINEGINGWLVEDGNIELLKQKICHLKPKSLNKDIIQNLIKENFNLMTIAKEYEELFLKI